LFGRPEARSASLHPMSDVALASHFFIQVAAILLACRLVAWLCHFFSQTRVIGEMLAGILLGPSLFGLLAPQAQAWLFPKTLILGNGTPITHPSMSILYVTSQLGLVLYMFIVGLDFDLHLLSDRIRTAASVSVAGIIVPFCIGAAASLLVAGHGPYFTPTVSPGIAALYLGASMSITAFPTLARIINEQKIAKTTIGTLALSAGAINDAAAWCLLAIVLAALKGTPSLAWLTIGGSAAFAFTLIFLGKPLLSRLQDWFEQDGRISGRSAITVFVVLMAGAWLTDAIGIYSVFGAFVIGTCMPKGSFSVALKGQIEQITLSMLVPIFFVYSGLNTQVNLISGVEGWLITGLLLACAIAGKLLGCMFAARVSGESWRTSTAIGVLMNARGLMELIILNIGLKQGVITPTLFTMLVLMAIVTTLMTSPLFKRIYVNPNAGSGAAA
jgi:Kef-type K+ transport system membrane component KefB